MLHRAVLVYMLSVLTYSKDSFSLFYLFSNFYNVCLCFLYTLLDAASMVPLSSCTRDLCSNDNHALWMKMWTRDRKRYRIFLCFVKRVWSQHTCHRDLKLYSCLFWFFIEKYNTCTWSTTIWSTFSFCSSVVSYFPATCTANMSLISSNSYIISINRDACGYLMRLQMKGCYYKMDVPLSILC